MLTTLKERTETEKALSVGNGNGVGTQGLKTAGQVYRDQVALVKTLLAIEREIEDSQSWMHPGACACEICVYEMNRQRRLQKAREQILNELRKLADDADEEIECARCCQPFRPVWGDERLCESCNLRENGLRW